VDEVFYRHARISHHFIALRFICPQKRIQQVNFAPKLWTENKIKAAAIPFRGSFLCPE